MNKKDREALQLAMVQVRQGKDARGDQLDRMLKGGRSPQRVAEFAALHCQVVNLNLKPWQIPPGWGNYCRGRDDEGWALFKRMRACGVSKWHPDPIVACEAAEKAAGTS
jgi:hypothetical protein